MRIVLTAVLFAAAGAAHAQPVAPPETCDYGAPHENAPPELAQFAFLIGDYKVTLHQWLGESWSPAQAGVSARWNGRYGLGGMAIFDEWFHPDPAQDPDASRGVNVRMYDPDAEEWDMMWVATNGKQVQDLRAKMIDGILTMWQVYPERPGFRAEFNIEGADNWNRISYGVNDDGAPEKQFKLAASRIPCAE